MGRWTRIDQINFNGVLVEDVFEWLEDMCASPDDWKLDEDAWGDERIYVRDPNIALLFKLTWGGV